MSCPEVKKIIEDIKKHNKEVYDLGKDISESKKNWGSDVIPKKHWIDVSKEYTTRSGHKVELHGIVMENCCNKEVTFPVKGTIYTERVGKKTKLDYAIWTLDGRHSVFHDESPIDLVLKGDSNE